MSNYGTKIDLKNAKGVDTSSFVKKTDLRNLKSDVDNFDIDKLKCVSTNVSNLKSKVHKLDIDKLVPVAVDLSRLSDAVKNAVAKKDVYNAQIKTIEDKIPDITTLATNASLNSKINEVTTTTALTAVENKIPSVSNLVIKIDYNTTITEIKNKFTDHDHIIAHGFRRLTSENVTARLRQANLASKNDIANFVKQD